MPVELECPWCETTGAHVRTRCHDDGDEYRCTRCGKVHTRKPGNPDAFIFFPGDIAAAVQDP